MPRSLLAALLRGLAVVAGVVTLTFFLLRLAPGDPAERLLGATATAEQVAEQRRVLGLDRPLPAQYVTWVAGMTRGDWGTSIATGRPVSVMIGNAWPFTVRLVGVSLVLSYLLGIAIGAAQAARGGSRTDTALSVVTVSLFAMPGYWLGLMLVMLFTYQWRVLPSFGAAGFDADFLGPGARFADAIRHLALPLLTLTLIGLGGTARYVRAAMLDLRSASFATVAAAKGISRRRVVYHHLLRNALIPIVTLLGLSLPALFSGAVFIEAIFAWPGVGRVLVEGVQARDYPVVMAAATISAVLVVAGNLLAEALATVVDPRLRRPAAP